MDRNRRGLVVALAALGVALGVSVIRVAGQQARPGKAYDLRVYTASAGRLSDVQNLVRTVDLPLFAKFQIENVFEGAVVEGARGDGDQAGNMFVSIVAYPNQARAASARAAFDADATRKAAWDRANASTPLLSKAAEVVPMTPTDFSPVPTPSGATGSPRAFELRKYNTGVEGTPWTVSQFKDGLAAIIAKQGMTPIAYWTASDNSAFIYLLAHKDREAARASWSTFLTDFRPFMTEFNAKQAAAGIAAPSAGSRRPDENRFLVPADFSPIR